MVCESHQPVVAQPGGLGFLWDNGYHTGQRSTVLGSLSAKSTNTHYAWLLRIKWRLIIDVPPLTILIMSDTAGNVTKHNVHLTYPTYQVSPALHHPVWSFPM
jgi:hypothetical protein